MGWWRNNTTGEVVNAPDGDAGYSSGWTQISAPATMPNAQQEWTGGAWQVTMHRAPPLDVPSPPIHPVSITTEAGRYASCCVNASALTTAALANNRLDLVPFSPGMAVTITELAIEVTTLLASAQARLGIYGCTVAGQPGALITSSDLLDCSTVGVKAWTLTAPVRVAAETHVWIALHSTLTATIRAIPLAALAPIAAPASGTAIPVLKRATPNFASGMPATPPALTNTSAVAPWVRIRLS